MLHSWCNVKLSPLSIIFFPLIENSFYLSVGRGKLNHVNG